MSLDGEKISVIVPIYKVEEYLRECLDSVLAQTYENLEVLLVDDGSPDNCGAICDEYAARDARFVAIHRENGGVSAARNAGLRRASGEWIGYVDPDDYVRPDMFERMHRAAVEDGADIVVCAWQCFGDSNKKEIFPAGKLDPKEALHRLLRNEIPPHNCNKLYRRALFEGEAYLEGHLYEDLRIMHKLFLKCKRISVIEDVLYFYRFRAGSITNVNRGLSARERIESREARSADLRGTEFYTESQLRVLVAVRAEMVIMLEQGDSDSDFFRELHRKGLKLLPECFGLMPWRMRVRYAALFLAPKLHSNVKRVVRRGGGKGRA